MISRITQILCLNSRLAATSGFYYLFLPWYTLYWKTIDGLLFIAPGD